MHRSVLWRLRPYGVAVTIAVLLLPVAPIEAKTRKGDRLFSEAQTAESKGDFDKAMMFAVQAMSSDPADPAYQLILRRVRFEAASDHVSRGQKLRAQGSLTEALAEFQKAYDIDPASDIADQEIRRTKSMIEREERRRKEHPDTPINPEEAALTPTQAEKQRIEERISSMLPVPELHALNTQPITLRMNGQKPHVLFDTVGKLAGINVLVDPDFDTAQTRQQSIDLNGSTLEESLNYIAVITHSFWKPLSANTIFVTQENPTKRREYEDEVVKVFYLSNITSPTELNEMLTTLRQVIEVQKVFNYSSQNAIVIRAEPGKMALAEKIIADLDKPKSEVLIDVMVMEVDSTRSRQLAAAFAPTGINTTINFTPRTAIQTLPGQVSSTSTSGFNNNTSTSTSTSSTSTTSTGTTASTTSTTPVIPLVNFPQITTQDFSLSNVPGGLLQAVLSDTGTRVLQRPELRALDNFKAELKIGDKVPTATGSFQPGVGGVGVNPLVNTQFTYIDTGVNLAITPRVHENGEVTLHMDIDISQVSNYVDLGGIQQPVISQQKATVDVRMRDGQINLIGGLMQVSSSKTKSGVPGLANIPILSRLFTSDQTTDTKNELLISLTPHIVRGPDITEENLRGVYSGNGTDYEVRYAPRKVDGAAQASGVTSPAGTAPTSTATVPMPVATLPATGTQPAAPGVPPAPPARVSFAPSQLSAQTGSTFTVSVRAEGAVNLQSVESQIKFDPKILKVNAIQAGDLLQQNGLSLQPQRTVLNDIGSAGATLVRDPGKGAVNGSGSLLTITFQAIAPGQTIVTIPTAILRDAQGNGGNLSGQPLAVTVK